MFADFLACPVCGGALSREGGSLYCDARAGRRHCYDIAAAGYVNLLPPGRGGNARTGDAAEMLAARTAFLRGGYYDLLSDAAVEAAVRHLRPAGASPALLDAGCGEGYHTCRIAAGIAARTGSAPVMCGLDASKIGAAAGARCARTQSGAAFVSFAAGNIFAMPVQTDAVDAVFSLFAPIPAAEAARVLHENGILVVVAAAPRHLWELRCLLYDEPHPGGETPAAPAGFALLGRYPLSQTVHLPDAHAVRSLFFMTPFSRHTPAAGRERLMAADALDVTVAADISVWKKED